MLPATQERRLNTTPSPLPIPPSFQCLANAPHLTIRDLASASPTPRPDQAAEGQVRTSQPSTLARNPPRVILALTPKSEVMGGGAIRRGGQGGPLANHVGLSLSLGMETKGKKQGIFWPTTSAGVIIFQHRQVDT
mmetsp:Transcript_6132/g.11549  ORF Transcript_6132/g.11549 Transcript_6132/m.11549 type:complete len:135 (+) Transcript_6132:510-914(+)